MVHASSPYPARQPASARSPASTTRLYVGNLHPSVSEYDLVQLFTPFGKFSKLDIVFHKSGPVRGKPKGYAFVEFLKEEEALRAKVSTDGKPFQGGRNLQVGFAAQRTEDQASSFAGGATGPQRRSRGDELKPTTLSMIKNSQRPQGTNAKIAAMEAKLLALKHAKATEGTTTPPTSEGQSSNIGAAALKRPPISANLPRKPSVPATKQRRP